MSTSLPWGIPFPRVPWDLAQPPTGSPAYLDHVDQYRELSASVAHWSYPVHPTQLYGVLGLLALCGILLSLRKHWHPFAGFTFPLYFMLYGIGRFIVEFFRGDHNPTVFDVLSQQQIFSLVFVAIGVAIFFILRGIALKERART
jgi:prolipoprotein diacylglyceryltransferase